MKAIICNTHQTKGGAAKAANRIAKALTLNNVENTFVALEGEDVKKNESFLFRNSKIFWSRLEQYQKFFSSKDFSAPFSASQYSLGYLKYVEELNPDIVSLHYINNGLFSIKDISKINRPIVWTLHDSWAFTGGCHLPLDCELYKKKCGNCPVLNMGVEDDLSRDVWETKNKYWQKADVTIVTPSKWLAECARESSLFKNLQIEVIPNPLDVDVFKRTPKSIAREELGLDLDKKYILFGAVDATRDKNKGFHFLKEVLNNLKIKDVELLVFGSKRKEQIDLNVPVRDLGFIDSEKKLAKIYSACDITAIPSVSENQPNIALESMACGTPIVGFEIKGLQEVVIDDRFGILAKPYDVKDLKLSIEKMLSQEYVDGDYIAEYINENFNFIRIGKRYKDLFESILAD